MIKLDTQRQGRNALWKTYQQAAIDYVRDNPRSTTMEVFTYVSKTVGIAISRASIINFLKGLAEEGLMIFDERSGKGGFHGLYTMTANEKETDEYIAKKIISSLQAATKTNLEISLKV